MIGLSQPEASDLFSVRQERQPFPLLLFGSERQNRIHHQRALNADEAAKPAVAAFEFLHDEAVGDVVHVGAAVFFGRLPPKRPIWAISGISSFGKGRVFEVFVDDRNHAVIDKSPNRIANHAFFVAQQVVDSVKVDTFEWHQTPPLKKLL